MTHVVLAAILATLITSSDASPSLTADPAVKAMLAAIQQNEPAVIEEQIRLCEIPAPEFEERERGAAVAAKFTELGLRNVRTDASGNVIGERPGASATPRVVFAAHLDTVFPEGTDVRVRREGARLAGPGIGDDCRGLAVLIAIARTLQAAQFQTRGTLVFVADVGEEGLGDLRGVKRLFNDDMKGAVDAFVSVDGTGFGITNVGVGSHRYRVTITGPGGHSFGAFGLANPIDALGRAIAAIADLQVPATPKTTFNVGRVGGGTSVNSIPFEAWMEVDMRSSDHSALEALDASFNRAVDHAVSDELARWKQSGQQSWLKADKKLVGDRPAGRTPADARIVQAALDATRALGIDASLGEGSTDSNIPMSVGIPAVTISGGGKGSGAHSPAESFDATDSWKGTARALLLALALVG